MLSAKTLFITMVTGSLLLTGCQKIDSLTSQSTAAQSNTMINTENKLILNTATLADYHWQLLSAKDKQGDPLSALEAIKDQVRLKFYLQQSTQYASFTVGCNSMSGNFTISNQQLKIGDVISTEMYCEDLDPAERLMAQLMPGNSKLKLSVENPSKSTTTQPLLTQEFATGETLVWQGTATAEAKYQQQPDLVFWEVNHQLQDCPNPDQKTCLKVRPVYYDEQGIKKGVGDWDIFVDNIEGYNHDSSVDTVLRLKRFTVDPVEVKGKQFVYVFDRIVESSVVN
ncbi:META domain protein [Psychrobacter pasteurii]|uniref:META domain protein n=1 Tax=Psychrobacter pasteurii TaxID=1945520 RepID=A0A1R4EI70_9GAMM|nr:META domain-containing protein [Psychrobacter pasteurii]SJM38227.1 META domain protein [Psychrobacter pasteurii]